VVQVKQRQINNGTENLGFKLNKDLNHNKLRTIVKEMLRIRRVLKEKKLLNLIARSSRTRWMSSGTEVMSFGDGSHGALGLPTSLIGHGMDAYEPTPVTGLPSDITSVSAGHYHSLAVTSHGQLWAWGRNHEVQLGRGLLSPRSHFH